MVLQVTIATAIACTLLYVLLSMRVISARKQSDYKVAAPASEELLMRIRIHANFAEYVPLALLLLGLNELAGAPRTWLVVLGIVLFTARVFHVIGMPRPAPNPFRLLGVLGTFAVLLVNCAIGLYMLRPALLG